MSPPPVKRFLHDVSHRSVSSRGRLGAARGFSRRNVAFQGAPNTRRRVQAPVRFGWPSACAGPVTRAPRSGTSPVVANRTGATSSFPGSATIPRLPGRPSRALTYCTDHPDSAPCGWWWSQRQAIRARCLGGIGLPALPGPGRGPPRRPAPARPCRPAASGSAGRGTGAPLPAEARRSGRSP